MSMSEEYQRQNAAQPMADTCSMCAPHPFHGLPCERKRYSYPEGYDFTISEQCKCPGPFGVPNA